MRNVNELLLKAKKHTLKRVSTSVLAYEVTSCNDKHLHYVAETNEGLSCSCDWGLHNNPSVCSHTVAVYLHLLKGTGLKLSLWSGLEQAKRQHRKIVNLQNGVWGTLRKV